MAKLGNKARDIFKKPEKKIESSVKAEAADRPKKAGRPKVHKDVVMKTLVTIRKSQLLWLDRLAIEIRERCDLVIDRGLLVRAIIDAIMESKLDLSGITSEEEAKKIILDKIRK